MLHVRALLYFDEHHKQNSDLSLQGEPVLLAAPDTVLVYCACLAEEKVCGDLGGGR